MSSGQYRAYPKYKATGAAWLESAPESWDAFDGKRIFESCRETARSTDEQLAASQKFGVVPQSLMMELNDAKVMLALKGTSTFRHVEKHDFVISLRSFEGGIEYSAYTGCVSPAYTVLRAKKPVVSAFYKHLLKSRPYISALQATTDSLRDGKAINYEQFGAIPLILPPLAEQTQIAKFLDHETAKIDRLIEKQEALIRLLKEKRQAVISHAVTKGLNPHAPLKDSGIEWLGQVPAHWQLKRLKYCTVGGKADGIQTGPFGGMLTDLIYAETGEYKLYGQENVLSADFDKGGRWISERKYRELIGYQATQGDFLFTRKGSIGGCAVFPKEAKSGIIDSDTIRLRVDPSCLATDFLSYAFRESDYLQTQVQMNKRGAILSGLNSSTIEELLIVMPSTEEQQSIVRHLDAVTAKIQDAVNTAENGVSLLQERRTALISAAVTGKIDVRAWQPAIPKSA